MIVWSYLDHLSRYFFIRMETSPRPVEGFKFRPLLRAYGNWVVRVLQRATPTVMSSPRTRDSPVADLKERGGAAGAPPGNFKVALYLTYVTIKCKCGIKRPFSGMWYFKDIDLILTWRYECRYQFLPWLSYQLPTNFVLKTGWGDKDESSSKKKSVGKQTPSNLVPMRLRREWDM